MTLVTLGVLARGAYALPGPPLRVGPDDSFVCEPGAGDKAPVLLVHGTFVTAAYWNGNFRQALERDGHTVCVITVPNREFSDVQSSVEPVVAAARAMYRSAHRRIAIVGHSQGALLATLALRFWPDLAGKVSDVVGLAGVYENGTATATALCAISCPPAAFQIAPGSRFLTAYRAKPLFAGPSYTSIATGFDEVVTPQPRGSHLDGARNIALQDVCPGRFVEHMAIATDALAYALARDAIEHLGSANPRRIDPAVCGQTTIPGSTAEGLAQAGVEALQALPGLGQDHDKGEPALECWLDPACAKRRVRPRMNLRVHGRLVRGRLVLPPGALHQCGGTIRVGPIRTALSPACHFAARLRRGERVRVRYPGSAELLPVRRRK